VCKKNGKQQSKNRNPLKIALRNTWWIPTTQDSTNEAAERRLLRAAAGYKSVDHIRKLTIRKKLMLFNILYMRAEIQYKLVSSYGENERKQAC
jgi:hypothetical protein